MAKEPQKEIDVTDDDQPGLISALKRRDRSAWSGVVERHFRPVYGFVYHLVGRNRSLAEDVTQESWLEAVDGIDRCDEAHGTFRNWLFGIARKRVAMHYRRRAAAGNPMSHGNPGGEVAEPRGNAVMPEDVLEQVEQSAVVRAAMLMLPEDRREVLLLKYVEGLSVKEIAARRGKSAKAVESLLSRAREQLRESLRGYILPCGDERPVSEESSHE